MRFVAMILGGIVLSAGVDPLLLRAALVVATLVAAWQEGKIEGELLGRIHGLHERERGGRRW